MWLVQWLMRRVQLVLTLGLIAGCAGGAAPPEIFTEREEPVYQIGPGDSLELIVWGDSELTTTAQVRPDGRISVPLVGEIYAARKTPSDLADEVERELALYVTDPLVTVVVRNVVGEPGQQIRVFGAVAQPKAIPYRADMTVLDVLIEVGGMTEFADGNRTRLVRKDEAGSEQFTIRLRDLLQRGDLSANARVLPGDVIIIPESVL